MSSDATWYFVDLSGLDQAEYERVYNLIREWAFTGPKEEGGYRRYTFVWNDPKSVEEVTGLPSSAFRRLNQT